MGFQWLTHMLTRANPQGDTLTTPRTPAARPENQPGILLVMQSPSEQRMQAVVMERYQYIHAQITAANEASYRYLALFQTLTTGIVTAGLALYVGHREWGIAGSAAKQGLIGLLVLQTVIACFTCALLIAGIASWFDYRREEVTLINNYLGQSFRTSPELKNFYRWYETYIVLLMLISTGVLWLMTWMYLLPALT